MKHSKRPDGEVVVNPQLLESMLRDLGIEPPEAPAEPEVAWTPPPRPQIPFHSIMAETMKEPDATEELYAMYQKTKHLIR
jgi:hypothetical protein